MMKVEDATLEDLERRSREVPEEMAKIRSSLLEAKGKAAATGDYADRNWFNRASYALRMKGHEHQLVLQELAKRKREERRTRNDVVERLFIQAARKRLEPDVFASIMAEATDTANYVGSPR